MRPSLLILLATLALQARPSTEAMAQRSSTRFFLEARARTVLYLGDRGLQNVSGMQWLTESFGPGAEISVGYRLSESVDIVGKIARDTYPGIVTNRNNLEHLDPSSSVETLRSYAAEMRYRFLPFGKYEPSVLAGLGFTSGKLNGDNEIGIGPVFGIGVSRPFGPITIFSQIQQHLIFPNSALDAAGAGGAPDALTSFGIGARYHFKMRIPSLGAVRLSSPDSLWTFQEVVFSVATDLDPYEYSVRWEFSDGNAKSGHSVVHSFSEEGAYGFTVFVSNARETTRLESSVQVTTRYDEVKITSVSIIPMSARTNESILFQPIILGIGIACQWDFGDGSGDSKCSTRHSYRDPGVYEVVLSASNPEHFDNIVRQVSVETDVCGLFPELVPVYFAGNSADLSLEMRQLLRENFSSSAPCPDKVLEVNGFAFDSERDALQLAQKRAESVLQYYHNLGVPLKDARLGSLTIQKVESYTDLVWKGRKSSTILVTR